MSLETDSIKSVKHMLPKTIGKNEHAKKEQMTTVFWST